MSYRESFRLGRYANVHVAYSSMDHLHDALDILSFLSAPNYVKKCLKTHHGHGSRDASKLAQRIAAHSTLAVQYVKLTRESSPEIAFLPAYYAVLNLSKICTLSGPFSTEFKDQTRWHGATYNAHATNPLGLLSDSVRVRGGGALALFYKTLTGHPITRDHTFKMREIYPLVPGIGSELQLITGNFPSQRYLKFEGTRSGTQVELSAQVYYTHSGLPCETTVSRIPALKGFRRDRTIRGFLKNGHAATLVNMRRVIDR